MTLEEAIKELEQPDRMITEYQIPVYSEAVRLAIEALKFTQAIRLEEGITVYMLLPGET